MPLQPIDNLIQHLKSDRPFDRTSALKLYEALKRLSDYLLKFGSIEGRQLATDAVIRALNEANQGWSTDIVFSATDNDTVSWTAGKLRFQDGSIANITAGNTGNMTALSYIYYDANISQTQLLTTTDTSKIVGDRRTAIAVAENAAAGQDAFFLSLAGAPRFNQNQLSNNAVNQNIVQDNAIASSKIQTDAITAIKIQAGAVTALKISVAQLSAISADIGSVTAGTLTGLTVRTSSGNPKLQMTSSGLFGTNSGGSNVFEVSSAAGFGIVWAATSIRTGLASSPVGMTPLAGADTLAVGAPFGTSANATYAIFDGDNAVISLQVTSTLNVKINSTGNVQVGVGKGIENGGGDSWAFPNDAIQGYIAATKRMEVDAAASSTQTALLLEHGATPTVKRVQTESIDHGSGAKDWLYV